MSVPADAAKWQYRDPPPAATGHSVTKRRLAALDRIAGGRTRDGDALMRDAGASTAVGSARRGGSSTLDANGDDNMDGHRKSHRMDMLSRRGRHNIGIARDPVRGPERDRFPHVEVIIDFVHRKYQPVTQFLNLDDMFSDQLLRTQGITRWGGHPEDKLATVLWKAAGELEPPVLVLSAANNQIGHLQLSRLPLYMPSVECLSLKNNSINSIVDLTALHTRSNRGMRKLRELVLTENPVRTIAEQSSDPLALDEYRYNVQSFIRSLRVLDGEAIPRVEFRVAEPAIVRKAWPDGVQYSTTFPLPVAPSFVESHLHATVTNVLGNFFAIYDSDRIRLLNAYAPIATFSVSTSAKEIHRNLALRYKPEDPTVAIPGFEQFKELQNIPDVGSRNLKQLATAQVRLDSLHRGPANIIRAMRQLPASSHPLQDGSKFVFDTTVLPDMGSGEMLFVTVHGEFMDTTLRTMFSFNRSFTFVAAPQGHPVHTEVGIPVLIVSDILVIKKPTTNQAFQPGAIITQEEAYALLGQAPGEARRQGKDVIMEEERFRPQHPGQAPPPMPQPQPIQQPIQQQAPYQQPVPQMHFPSVQFPQPPAQQSVPQPVFNQQMPAESAYNNQPPQAPTPQPQFPMQQQPPQPQGFPQQMGQQNQQPPPDLNHPVLADLNDDQRGLVLAISGETGVIYDAVRQCLVMNDWEPQAAFAQVVALMPGMGREFYLRPPA